MMWLNGSRTGAVHVTDELWCDDLLTDVSRWREGGESLGVVVNAAGTCA